MRPLQLAPPQAHERLLEKIFIQVRVATNVVDDATDLLADLRLHNEQLASVWRFDSLLRDRSAGTVILQRFRFHMFFKGKRQRQSEPCGGTGKGTGEALALKLPGRLKPPQPLSTHAHMAIRECCDARMPLGSTRPRNDAA